ncbi:MAG: hypothetical protein AAGJ50_02970 [Pseudomonadota bacterium]
MPKEIIYIGRDDSSPDEVTVRGLVFQRGGDAVLVKDDILAENLSNNPEFKAVGDVSVAAEQDPSKDNDLLGENRLLRAQLEAAREEIASLRRGVSEASEQPPKDADIVAETYAAIDAEKDWSQVHHATRIRWANALSDDPVATAGEADQVILNALIERESGADGNAD